MLTSVITSMLTRINLVTGTFLEEGILELSCARLNTERGLWLVEVVRRLTLAHPEFITKEDLLSWLEGCVEPLVGEKRLLRLCV